MSSAKPKSAPVISPIRWNSRPPDPREALDITVKGPIPILLEDLNPDLRSGCSILEVHFKQPVTIGEIRFRNYYTAYLTIYCKRKQADDDKKVSEPANWETSVKRLEIMSDPHCEQGSQDVISITQKDSRLAWMGILCFRLILRQPSPQWRKFGIGDLKVYRQAPLEKPSLHNFTRMIGGNLIPANEGKIIEQYPTFASTSRHLQNMWAQCSSLKIESEARKIGRYEVSGNYDVDYLTYN